MWYRKCALQYKEQGEKKYQFKNGGIRQWGKQNKNEDQQNDGLKHLEQWQLKEKWEWREEWWALEEEKCGGEMWQSLLFLSAYRKWLLCLFVVLLGDIQAVYEALQLFPEGFHLCVDTIQQLVLSDPEEEQVWTFKIR